MDKTGEEMKMLIAFNGLRIIKVDNSGDNIIMYCKYKTKSFQIAVGTDGSLTLYGDVSNIIKVISQKSAVPSPWINIPLLPTETWYSTNITTDNTGNFLYTDNQYIDDKTFGTSWKEFNNVPLLPAMP